MPNRQGNPATPAVCATTLPARRNLAASALPSHPDAIESSGTQLQVGSPLAGSEELGPDRVNRDLGLGLGVRRRHRGLSGV